MYFYKKMYVDDALKKNRRKVCWNLKHNKGQLDVYVISLAAGNDLFDIFHCSVLKQKAFPREKVYILGIAKGYENAVLLSTKMVQDFSTKYNSVFFKQKFVEQELQEFKR